MASGELSRPHFIQFLMSSVSALLPVLQSGGLLYICMDWRHLCDLQSTAEQLGLTPMNLCVWAKTNAGMGTFYRDDDGGR
jgi:DNA modification methylase